METPNWIITTRKQISCFKLETNGLLYSFDLLYQIKSNTESIKYFAIKISNYEKAEVLKNDYHFFGCIHYIGQVKTGPFAEHSNQLWNISGVMSWNKVYTGLIKMYRAEMLSKFPIIQHTYFGSIFRLDEAKDRRATSKLDAGRPPPRPKFNPSNLPTPPSFSVKQPN